MSIAGMSVLRHYGFQANVRPVVLVAAEPGMVFSCGNPRATYDFLRGTFFPDDSPDGLPPFEQWVEETFEEENRNLDGYHAVIEAFSGTEGMLLDLTYSQIQKGFPQIELPKVYAGFFKGRVPWPVKGKSGRKSELDVIYTLGPELPESAMAAQARWATNGTAADLKALTQLALPYGSDFPNFLRMAIASKRPG